MTTAPIGAMGPWYSVPASTGARETLKLGAPSAVLDLIAIVLTAPVPATPLSSEQKRLGRALT